MRLSGACALALILGALRYQASIPDLDSPQVVAYHNDRGWVTLEGIVRSYPDIRDTRIDLLLNVDWIEVQDEGYETHGRVLVRAARFPEYHYGDRLRVHGHLKTPPVFQDDVMAEYSFNDNALMRVHERLKDALDPNGIISAGRYGVWPEHLRDGEA